MGVGRRCPPFRSGPERGRRRKARLRGGSGRRPTADEEVTRRRGCPGVETRGPVAELEGSPNLGSVGTRAMGWAKGILPWPSWPKGHGVLAPYERCSFGEEAKRPRNCSRVVFELQKPSIRGGSLSASCSGTASREM